MRFKQQPGTASADTLAQRGGAPSSSAFPQRLTTLLRPILLISWIGLGSACAPSVSPWERGTLAKPQMALVPDVQREALMQHTYFSKEASTGGYGVGGGGCGCN